MATTTMDLFQLIRSADNFGNFGNSDGCDNPEQTLADLYLPFGYGTAVYSLLLIVCVVELVHQLLRVKAKRKFAQYVFLVLICLACLGRASFFIGIMIAPNVITNCEGGLMEFLYINWNVIPCLFFFSSSTFVLFFWVDLYYRMRHTTVVSVSDENLMKSIHIVFFSSTFFLFALYLLLVLLMATIQTAFASMLYGIGIGAFFIIVSLVFFVYGARLYILLSRIQMNVERQSQKRRHLFRIVVVTGVCGLCSILRGVTIVATYVYGSTQTSGANFNDNIYFLMSTFTLTEVVPAVVVLLSMYIIPLCGCPKSRKSQEFLSGTSSSTAAVTSSVRSPINRRTIEGPSTPFVYTAIGIDPWKQNQEWGVPEFYQQPHDADRMASEDIAHTNPTAGTV